MFRLCWTHLTLGTGALLGAVAGLSCPGCLGAMGGRLSGGRSLGGCWLAAPAPAAARSPVSTREETARARLLGGGAAPGPADTSVSDRGRFTGAI